VNRDLAGTRLEATLHDQAYTGGTQLQHRWADSAWTANINLLGSWVHGSPEAIAATQQSPVHYFQRPDATDVHFDPTRSSLSGLAATWQVGQLGDTQHWRFGTFGELRTAGLELNDAGFQRSSDRLNPGLLLQYHDDAPGEHLLNWGWSFDAFTTSTFEPRLLNTGLDYSANVQFANYWQFSVSGYSDFARWLTNALRGGGTLRNDAVHGGSASITTDTRKPVWFSLGTNAAYGRTTGFAEGAIDLGATLQARSNLDLFLGPSVYFRDDPLQYVAEVAGAEGDASHFVFARIRETDVSLTLRMNWTFSPRLALQAYAQPFIAAGRYSEFKDIDHPDARRYTDRFRLLAPGDVSFTGSADPSGAALQLDRPDFNFRQLRSTVVMRWEYRPGSTVFAIWSHGRTSDTFDDGRFRFGRDLGDLGAAASENVVMVKANYWIGL
jgi:hypothetical protein